MKITNNSNVPLALAVWAVHDEYDYINEPNYVSVTKLMKPIRHIVLPPRVPPEAREADITDYISRAMGHSLHDSIEKSWVKGYKINLKRLGFPESQIERVKVNPEPTELAPNDVPVYLEQRAFRKVTVNGNTYTIGGKFDMVAEGIVHDNKSTTAYTWQFGGRDEDYKLQGSIYRWLNHNGYKDAACTEPIGVARITEDFIRICFIFTDWSKAMAKANPAYPQQRCMFKEIPLMSIEETEAWVVDKLTRFEHLKDVEEHKLPPCTQEELWMSDPTYKYYSDPAKTAGRSTKNFETAAEARAFMIEKGGKGILKTIPGEAKRCAYCDAYSICTQKEKPKYD